VRDTLSRTPHDGRTFNIWSSFKPSCISSCCRLASCTSLFSRKASLVLLFAYSLKLYDANCSPCRNNWRYCGVLRSARFCGNIYGHDDGRNGIIGGACPSNSLRSSSAPQFSSSPAPYRRRGDGLEKNQVEEMRSDLPAIWPARRHRP